MSGRRSCVRARCATFDDPAIVRTSGQVVGDVRLGRMTSIGDMRETFWTLHGSGTWVLPNPWDIGSAKLLASAGFPALATTSSGLAASLGVHDQNVGLEQLARHVAALTGAVAVPVNVDAERCFAPTAAGIPQTIHLLADAGASGISIADYDPATGVLDPLERAVERVAVAAEAAHRHSVVLTARAENALYQPVTDAVLKDIIDRLIAYRDAGADCLYAPGLVDPAHIAKVVAIGSPVNVLALAGGPTVAELTALGVRRISTGGSLAFAAYGAMMRAARELSGPGTATYQHTTLTAAERAAFD